MTEKRTLTDEEFARCASIVSAIQSRCHHTRKTTWSFRFEGVSGQMAQCLDCAMFNPGEFGCTPPAEAPPTTGDQG